MALTPFKLISTLVPWMRAFEHGSTTACAKGIMYWFTVNAVIKIAVQIVWENAIRKMYKSAELRVYVSYREDPLFARRICSFYEESTRVWILKFKLNNFIRPLLHQPHPIRPCFRQWLSVLISNKEKSLVFTSERHRIQREPEKKISSTMGKYGYTLHNDPKFHCKLSLGWI